MAEAPTSARLAFVLALNYMAKSISDNTKRRGRPKTTGTGTLIGIRLHKPQLARLDHWIKAQPKPRPTRPEAIRILLDKACAPEPAEPHVRKPLSSP